ncbi:MAG TPA: hypothetical protein VNN09_09305 [Candidatus Competibacteraceae bacterium]|nr:hypothetical protein [Candidatus Competibacteraceae bacterium]
MPAAAIVLGNGAGKVAATVLVSPSGFSERSPILPVMKAHPLEHVLPPPYRREHGQLLIEIRLHRLEQLFNSLDPAPFHERDLDPDAEQYIVSAAEELPAHEAFRLVFHLAPQALERLPPEGLEQAIHHYFQYQLALQRHALRGAMRLARHALLFAVLFLALSLSLSELLSGLGNWAGRRVVTEGLVILGWVAMWRPIEYLFYDWWPLRRRCRLYERLARVAVEVRRLGE